jgi:serpin B
MDNEYPTADAVEPNEPQVPALSQGEDQVPELVEGNTEFALDLYHVLLDENEGENLFYSPHSLSVALAMTYAGARGETEQQMAQALHYTLSQAQLPPAFSALDQALTGRSGAENEAAFQLHIADAIWGQQGYEFLDTFLDTLAENYGAGLRVVDFKQAEGARRSINQWVSDQTEHRIQDLVPPEVINGETVLVLTDAVYFKAAWMHPFAESRTRDDTFTLLDGEQVTVPMMELVAELGYAERAGVQALELPYAGDALSMVILLPEASAFEGFARGLDTRDLETILDNLKPTGVRLTMPKFSFDAKFKLKDALVALGMVDAFGDADFSGMDGTHQLFIREVCHQAFVAVDEAGTEASGASAVIMERKGGPVVEQEIRLDRPFIFMIRDTETGAILFLGHVVNPAA